MALARSRGVVDLSETGGALLWVPVGEKVARDPGWTLSRRYHRIKPWRFFLQFLQSFRLESRGNIGFPDIFSVADFQTSILRV